MKKYILIILIVLLTRSLVPAQSLYSPEVQKIVKRGKLIVAMYYSEYIPFFINRIISISIVSSRKHPACPLLIEKAISRIRSSPE